MSQQKSNQGKYANLNLNAALTSKSTGPATGSGPGSAIGGSTLTKGGLLVLSKRPRTATGAKLSIPKPVNLPSIKKEHAGNDPSTQLVPSGSGSGTWSKPEEAPAPPEVGPRQPSITAVSTWASQPPVRPGPPSAASPWQPPAVQARGPSSFPLDRHLNPEEYPSLAASAKADAAAGLKQGGKAGYDQQQDSRSWADDERAPPAGYRTAPDWSAPRGEKYEDDRAPGDRPVDYVSRSYEYARADRRYDYDAGYPPRHALDDEPGDFARRGGPYGGYDAYGPPPYRGHPDQPPPPPPRRGERFMPPQFDRGERYAGPYDPYDDRGLFPPPPPPRYQSRGEGPDAGDDEDEDLERKAFEAELARVAADLERRKNEERDSVAEKRSLPPDDEPSQSLGDSLAASDSEAPSHPRTSGQRGPSRFVSREEDEEDKKRKERAGEKLRQLEQQIASREHASKATSASGSGPASRRGVRDEDLDWDEDREGVPPLNRRGHEEEKDIEPPRAPLPPRAPPEHLRGPPPPPPPPPPPAHPSHQGNAWHQPHAPPTTAPTPPPPPPPQQQQPVTQPTTSQQPPSRPVSAVFGSFDEHLLEELTRQSGAPGQGPPPPPPPPPPQEVKPKPWRPAEGTTPILLTHASAQQQQQQKENVVPAEAKAETRESVDKSRLSEREPQPGRSERVGRGGGRGRGRGYSTTAEDVQDSAAEAAAAAAAAVAAAASVTTDLHASLGAGRGRGRGRGGRGSAPGDDSEPMIRGGRASRGRGRGRGFRGSTDELTATSSANGDVDSMDTGNDSDEPKSKRDRRSTSRDGGVGDVQSGKEAPARGGLGGRGDGGRGGRGEGRGGRGGRGQQPGATAPSVQTLATPPAAAPIGSQLTSAESSKAPGSEAADKGVPGGMSMPPWGVPAPQVAGIAKGVAGLSLNDPVLAGPVGVASAVNLPASLDPMPVSSGKPIGFDRQVGGKSVAPGPPQKGPSLGGSEALSKADAAVALDMPPLPADLSDIMSISSKPPGLVFGAAPGPGPAIRPLAHALFPGAPGDAPGSAKAAAGTPTSTATPPPGIAAMWEQPAFGPGSQPGSATAASSAAAAAAGSLGVSMQSFYTSGPSMFSGSPQPLTGPATAAGSQVGQAAVGAPGAGQQAPPPLMLSMGQFSQFGGGPFAAPPTRPFMQQSTFGTLGGGAFFGQQPFVPTNKQPDWSTGALGMGTQGTGLGPIGRLELGGMEGSFSIAPGTQAPGVEAGNPAPGQGQVATNIVGAGGFANPLGPPGPTLLSGGPAAFQTQGNAQVGANRLSAGFGNQQLGPHAQQQAVKDAGKQQQQPQRGIGPDALPDDIFGLDTKPLTTANKAAPSAASVQPVAAAPLAAGQVPAQAGASTRQAAVPPPPPGRDGGKGRGGRGRGGRGDVPDAASGGRGDGPGRGFAGRNGRGAGRVGAAGPGPAGASEQVPPAAAPLAPVPAASAAAAATAGGAEPTTSGGRGGRGGGRAGRGGRGGARAPEAGRGAPVGGKPGPAPKGGADGK
eukprot:CAMPEP_0202907676 /NCGR_PEP_ID=MMETSP1392-20130828/43468_1 /ASSEMBLY_ACC=CAM_ASM_000868 /TAXON_ID=225041 /ORGANISM="Chlamydomonas chlamydogama, Strain SAG 11-48b" /LENGTH=1511 /DNA_ID=CAMNT_0049596685 /DNA_START=73 /DNA_END=4608 /DNA_ORIENTATION=-